MRELLLAGTLVVLACASSQAVESVPPERTPLTRPPQRGPDYRAACESGTACACGRAAESSSAPEQKRTLFEAGCEAGDARSCGGLAALLLESPPEATRELERGRKLLESACCEGDPAACDLFEAEVCKDNPDAALCEDLEKLNDGAWPETSQCVAPEREASCSLD